VALNLLKRGASPRILIDSLIDHRCVEKDTFDRMAALAPVLTFVSSLVIAGIGWHFTSSYNTRQEKLSVDHWKEELATKERERRTAELAVVEKMVPHLTASEASKRVAILAISELASPHLPPGLLNSMAASDLWRRCSSWRKRAQPVQNLLWPHWRKSRGQEAYGFTSRNGGTGGSVC
jgi:hypothetical protein